MFVTRAVARGGRWRVPLEVAVRMALFLGVARSVEVVTGFRVQ